MVGRGVGEVETLDGVGGGGERGGERLKIIKN